MKARHVFPSLLQLLIAFSLIGIAPTSAALPADAADAAGLQGFASPTPQFSKAVAFDASAPLRELADQAARRSTFTEAEDGLVESRSDRGLYFTDKGYSGDGALQGSNRALRLGDAVNIPAPTANFEGLSNLDNFNLFGFRVNPPDPMGDVGPNHYVEMINLVFGVYDKSGALLLGPVPIGALWAGFAIDDCTDPSGDPVVIYDQFADRWLLSQFTTRGFDDPTLPFYNCVAISQTGDPTGAYYRYAFITQPDTVDGGYFFPDYPKYGVWTNSYLMTTRDFGTIDEYGISVYALEKSAMLVGNPNARVVQFFLDSAVVPLHLIGDGLLPADIDGVRVPGLISPAPIVGTMDDNYAYDAPFDALNIFELLVKWGTKPLARFSLVAQLPVAAFDSAFPCAPTSRDCLPQPGITDPNQYLDILSYRQRPTWRLAYRNFGKYEALVTNQSVEAAPGMAGVRWYEIRRTKTINGLQYSVFQQGTFAPDDGVHRWMGSIAMDKNGNIALGYSVVNGVDVYPGIRYTGRMSGDPLGMMSLGEGVVINGGGAQTTTNSRWGDYTSLNIDPVDDCTFWYVNEYYEVGGLPLPLPPAPLPPPGTTAPWQTRIASFTLPGCTP
ncbi:MAG: hypothetical protein L0Z70_15825 [Chloroflexi bacterium]|nr:hypothetical protein [Chloroflexota bacterium]